MAVRRRNLTFGMRNEIAERYMKGETAAALADEFGVNESTIRRIVEVLKPGYRKVDQ